MSDVSSFDITMQWRQGQASYPERLGNHNHKANHQFKQWTRSQRTKEFMVKKGKYIPKVFL